MAWHVYVVPVIGVGTHSDPRRAAYLSGMTAPYSSIDFGNQPQMLTAADVTTAQDTDLRTHNDVFLVPDDFDSSVGPGATLNNVRSGLEARDIPGNWIVSSTHYRQILRLVFSIFFLFQRYAAVAGTNDQIIQPPITLDSTFASLSAAVQQGLITSATQFDLNTSLFTGANLLRVILKDVGDQQAGIERVLGGVVI